MIPGSIKQIKTRLLKQWGRGVFLKTIASGEVLFPLEVVIKGPTSAEMVNTFDTVRSWVKEIKSECEKSRLQLVWKEINHRQLGRNSIPKKIIFSNITELAVFLGKKRDLQAFNSGLGILDKAFPELVAWAELHPFKMISNVADIERFITIVSWRLQNPHPLIYLRQLSLPGVDTKFIESHKKLLGQWLDIILGKDQIKTEFTGVGKFEQRYGFLFRPEMVRFRVSDPALQHGGYSDLTVRADEFAAISLSVNIVFIIENDITALAFPLVKNSMVIFGRGYNFVHLAAAHWLNKKELWYWGDIDTHGFAILNQFRSYFPGVRSFLMDRETLVAHNMHWGLEKTPTVANLKNLSREESILYDELRYNKIRSNLRLEQEFIDFSWVLEVINSILDNFLKNMDCQ